MFCLGLTAAAGTRGVLAQEKPTDAQMGVLEADSWLSLVDSGRYAESWAAAAPVFKAAVTAEKWEATLKQVRKPLGKMRSRIVQNAKHTTTLPGVPDGDYVFLLYDSSFEHKNAAQETVILSRDKNKVWQVSGYYIK